eukprot:1206351-Alexandrium_andersonii.AAC.1
MPVSAAVAADASASPPTPTPNREVSAQAVSGPPVLSAGPFPGPGSRLRARKSRHCEQSRGGLARTAIV